MGGLRDRITAQSGDGTVDGNGPGSGSGSGTGETVSYDATRVIGHGSFGVVFQAKVVGSDEVVAIKKVLQDKRFKNRELQIMKQLMKKPHPNVVQLKHCFFTSGSQADEIYLNLVLEYVPETVYSVAKQYHRAKQVVPIHVVQLYTYQLCRALAHIHGLGICHRDIKPQNLLVYPHSCVLKLCDFGSAKVLVRGEPNVSYICSRYYRAPELIFGATNYTPVIDVWSAGCVGAELLLGQPLFPGNSGVDQLVEIIKVLGTPTREEIAAMNPNYEEFRFPQIRAHPWNRVFRSHVPNKAIDFIAQTLVYKPRVRLQAIEACAHPFFDSLRDPNTRLPDGQPLPEIFGFTDAELKARPDLRDVLEPMHACPQQQFASPSASAAAAAAAGGAPIVSEAASSVPEDVVSGHGNAVAAAAGGAASSSTAAPAAAAAATTQSSSTSSGPMSRSRRTGGGGGGDG